MGEHLTPHTCSHLCDAGLEVDSGLYVSGQCLHAAGEAQALPV